jgi:hypothetical protein
MTDDRMDELIRRAAREYNRPGATPRDEIWERIQRARRGSPRTQAPAQSARRAWLWRGIGIAAVLVIGIGIGRMVERSSGSQSRGTVAANAGRGSSAAPVGARVDTHEGASATASFDSTPVAPQLSPALSPDRALAAASDERRPGPEARVPSTRNLAAAGRPATVGAPDDAPSEGLAFRLAVLQHLAGTEAMLTSFRASAPSGEVDAQLTTWARDLLRTTHMLQASSATANDVTLKRLLDDLELVLLQIAQYTDRGPHRAEELEFIEQAIDKRGVMTKLRATNPAAPLRAGT